MNKTTLQFRSLTELASFLESAAPSNFEVNYNNLTLNCELEQEVIGEAMQVFHATILEQEVLG